MLNRLLSVTTLATAATAIPHLRQSDVDRVLREQPSAHKVDVDGQWFSLSKDVEFMPSNGLPPLDNGKSRKLSDEDVSTTGGYDAYNPYSVQPFVQGMSDYDEYAQAWRLLGFVIDCNAVDEEEDRRLSGSADTTGEGCARYVLWAAYVDLNYEGGGIGEYQYWDKDSNSWDSSACNYADGGNSRCAKMDCHAENTNFSVLGFFKHRSYDDWMEQLFKHEGMCVWSDDEYSFMKDARKAWPRGCTDSGATTSNGQALYYDIKPSSYGRINIGMYTDTQCVVEYPMSTDEMENYIGNIFGEHNSGSGDGGGNDYADESLYESLQRWHSAFDVWHTCHPCVAYDIENTDGTKYAGGDDGYNNYYYYNNGNNNAGYYNNGNRKLGGEYSAQGDVFECYDDAGYTNVNQCMKFSAKTYMQTATFRDLSLGRTQATLVDSPLSGYFLTTDHYQKNTMGNIKTYGFLTLTVGALVFSVYNLSVVFKTTKRIRKSSGLSKEQQLLPNPPSM